VVTGGAEAKIPDRYMDEAYKIKYLWGRRANIKGGSRMKTFNNAYAVRLRQYHVLDVDGTGPFAIFTNGADVVLRAILRGNENSSFFSSLTQRVVEVNLRETKKQTALRTYYKLRGTDELDSMSLKEAVELADALIAENIRLAGADLGIGGQVAIATITRDRGFQWVEGHDPFVRLK
jgi:hypothetical protein